MEAKTKKIESFFLVISLLALSGNLLAKERRGAELLITKKDGQQIKGELIAVKEKSLLLLDAETGADVSVGISDISVVTIVKKSKFWKGAGWGFLIGSVGGGISRYASTGGMDIQTISTIAYAIVGGGIGALLGAGIGALAGKDEVIQIEGRPDAEVKEALEYLRHKKARIPDYQ